MHPTFQILERHRQEIDDLSCHYFDAPDVIPWISDQSNSFTLDAQEHSPLTPGAVSWVTSDLNILFYPKAKERLTWWLFQLQCALQKNQRLWVVGENDGGIKSLAKKLKGLFDCEKLDSARHCALFEITPNPGISKQDFWTQYESNGLTINALPGVFSAKKLDTGTSVLLEHLPALANGKILEMGSGSGVLACELLNRFPECTIETYDVDLLAYQSTVATIKANNLDAKASAYWANSANKLPPTTYQSIVTNPPFHKGIRTEYGPTESFFSQASDRLVRGGKLIWVANDFLNYQNLIKGQFKTLNILAQTRGFKVYEAVK